jgi:hypothetical protein
MQAQQNPAVAQRPGIRGTFQGERFSVLFVGG